MSLPGMAHGIAQLLDQLAWPVQAFIGHSAGAAIAAQMVLDTPLQPEVLIGINPAWLPLPGLAGLLFPPAAKLLAMTPAVPHWFARQASRPGVLEKLLQSTGSVLDARGNDLYAQLVASPAEKSCDNCAARCDCWSAARMPRFLQSKPNKPWNCYITVN
jgi:magnesium chelatase accessory protein